MKVKEAIIRCEISVSCENYVLTIRQGMRRNQFISENNLSELPSMDQQKIFESAIEEFDKYWDSFLKIKNSNKVVSIMNKAIKAFNGDAKAAASACSAAAREIKKLPTKD